MPALQNPWSVGYKKSSSLYPLTSWVEEYHPCVPTDLLCTHWPPVYPLTSCELTGLLCAHWPPVYSLTFCLLTDLLCTHWPPVYSLASCVLTDLLCTHWPLVYSLTSCVLTDLCKCWIIKVVKGLVLYHEAGTIQVGQMVYQNENGLKKTNIYADASYLGSSVNLIISKSKVKNNAK